MVAEWQTSSATVVVNMVIFREIVEQVEDMEVAVTEVEEEEVEEEEGGVTAAEEDQDLDRGMRIYVFTDFDLKTFLRPSRILLNTFLDKQTDFRGQLYGYWTLGLPDGVQSNSPC